VFLPKRSSGKLMATCRRGHARMSHDPFSELLLVIFGVFMCSDLNGTVCFSIGVEQQLVKELLTN
jgi:hypothetical protein